MQKYHTNDYNHNQIAYNNIKYRILNKHFSQDEQNSH